MNTLSTNLPLLASHQVKMILYTKSASTGLVEETLDPEISNANILCGSFNPLHEGHV